MSKGNPRVIVRFSDAELMSLNFAVNQANKFTRGEPYTVSSWIRKAVKEKIAHLERSKGKGKRTVLPLAPCLECSHMHYRTFGDYCSQCVADMLG